MNESLPLEIENLSYGLRNPVFSNANLSVRLGQFITLLVPDGSGKSTLIDCLYGNLKPTSGNIHFWGRDNRGFNREMIQQRVGWMITKKESYAPWVRVREDMLATSRLFRTWNPKLFQKLVERLDVNLDRRMSDLSLSDTTKVKFIKALSFEPELLVLDEMPASLTAETKDLISELLIEQFAIGEMAVIYICHSPTEAVRFNDHYAVLQRNGLVPQYRAPLQAGL